MAFVRTTPVVVELSNLFRVIHIKLQRPIVLYVKINNCNERNELITSLINNVIFKNRQMLKVYF